MDPVLLSGTAGLIGGLVSGGTGGFFGGHSVGFNKGKDSVSCDLPDCGENGSYDANLKKCVLRDPQTCGVGAHMVGNTCRVKPDICGPDGVLNGSKCTYNNPFTCGPFASLDGKNCKGTRPPRFHAGFTHDHGSTFQPIGGDDISLDQCLVKARENGYKVGVYRLYMRTSPCMGQTKQDVTAKGNTYFLNNGANANQRKGAITFNFH